MGVEIERKFLVDTGWLPELPDGHLMKQGYIRTGSFTSVRARIKGSSGYLTLKGKSSDDGLSRSEFEYEIPLTDAQDIIDELCNGGTVEKTRYELKIGKFLWELDIFSGANLGLVLAEVELPDLEASVQMPEWAIEEVTGDVRYYNLNLATSPWPNWKH